MPFDTFLFLIISALSGISMALRLSSAVPAVAELKSLDLSVSDSAKLLHAGSFVKGATSLVSLQTLHLDFRCPLQTADSLCRSLQNLNVLQAGE